MATNEEGEFELVLGNKQLLSVFFIVVLLLFVFFAMGYMVGRNTVPASTQIASNKAPSSPMVVEPAGSAPPVIPPATSPVAPQERPAPASAPVETKAAEPPKQTASLPPAPLPPPPAKPETPKVVKAEPATPTPAPPKVEPPKTTAKAPPPKVEPPKPPPAKPPATPAPPKPGAAATYLQVSATNRKEAELMAEVLSKKGFPAITTPVPDQPLYRVMVGPLRDAAAIAKTREGLEAAGFKSFIPRKL